MMKSQNPSLTTTNLSDDDGAVFRVTSRQDFITAAKNSDTQYALLTPPQDFVLRLQKAFEAYTAQAPENPLSLNTVTSYKHDELNGPPKKTTDPLCEPVQFLLDDMADMYHSMSGCNKFGVSILPDFESGKSLEEARSHLVHPYPVLNCTINDIGTCWDNSAGDIKHARENEFFYITRNAQHFPPPQSMRRPDVTRFSVITYPTFFRYV